MLFKASLCVFVFRDPLHRLWNNAGAAIKASGLWPLCLLITIVMGTDCGPWDDAKLFENCKAAVETYLALASTSCPLFLHFVEDVAAERGCLDTVCSTDTLTLLFEGLRQAWAKKRPSVATSRWFQMVQRLGQYVEIRTSRLLIYIYLAISMGIPVSIEHGGLLKTKLTTAGGDDDAEAEASTRLDKDDIRKIKKGSRNCIHFEILLQQDPDLTTDKGKQIVSLYFVHK